MHVNSNLGRRDVLTSSSRGIQQSLVIILSKLQAKCGRGTQGVWCVSSQRRWIPALIAGRPLSCLVTCCLQVQVLCLLLSQLCRAHRPLDLASGAMPWDVPQSSLKSYSEAGAVSHHWNLVNSFSCTSLPSPRTHSHIRGVLWERMFLGANRRHLPYVSPALRCHVFLWKVKLSSLENLSSRELTRLWFNSMSHSWNRCSMGIWPNKLSFFWSRVNSS